MRFAVVVFPGTWSDTDCHHAVGAVLGHPAEYIWHNDRDLSGFDAVILPGGFSYGDYLRAGAIARFSPIMETVTRFADAGGLVIGICNGFQMLCEASLLPGVLMRNEHLEFRCAWTDLRVENASSQFSHLARPGQTLRIPISHGEGNYQADAETVDELERAGRVVFRYATPEGAVTAEANPNGSTNSIAGIINERGNVLGMMPHPERACESLLGSVDGNVIFESMCTPLAEEAIAPH